MYAVFGVLAAPHTEVPVVLVLLYEIAELNEVVCPLAVLDSVAVDVVLSQHISITTFDEPSQVNGVVKVNVFVPTAGVKLFENTVVNVGAKKAAVVIAAVAV